MNLVSKIYDHFSSQEKRDSTSHHPSSAGFGCVRREIYKRSKTKESNPIDNPTYFKFAMGNSVHELLHEVLVKTGIEVIPEIEFKVTPPGFVYPISGRVDLLFIDDDKEIAGIEIKSTFGNGMYDIKQNGPKSDHLMQAACYLHCTEIKKWYILYAARDNGYMMQFEYNKENTKEYFNKALDFFSHVEANIAADKLPEREFIAYIGQTKNKLTGECKTEIKDSFTMDKKEYCSSWQCMYCNYQSLCWKDKLEQYNGKDNKFEVMDFYGKK
jgi:hypothetical protein